MFSVLVVSREGECRKRVRGECFLFLLSRERGKAGKGLGMSVFYSCSLSLSLAPLLFVRAVFISLSLSFSDPDVVVLNCLQHDVLRRIEDKCSLFGAEINSVTNLVWKSLSPFLKAAVLSVYTLT